MVRSPEMEEILNSYQGININFPKCGTYSLSKNELKVIKTLNDSSIAFFVGAGISFPYPSCLPKAEDILLVQPIIVLKKDNNSKFGITFSLNLLINSPFLSNN
jgi:hypothetical protein